MTPLPTTFNEHETALLDALGDYLKVRSYEHHNCDCSSGNRERGALDVVLTALTAYVEKGNVPFEQTVRDYLFWRGEKIGG